MARDLINSPENSVADSHLAANADGSGARQKATGGDEMADIGYANQIRQRIADIEARIKSNKAELDELRIAERVINRLAGLDNNEGQDDGQRGRSTAKTSTVAQMAVEAVKIDGPMKTDDLLAAIRKKWRPDLQTATLSSTLSRTKAAGKLSYSDGRWSLPASLFTPDITTTQSKTVEEPSEGGPVKLPPGVNI